VDISRCEMSEASGNEPDVGDNRDLPAGQRMRALVVPMTGP